MCHKQFQPNLYNLQQLSHKSCTQQLKFLDLNNEGVLVCIQQMDWPTFLIPNRPESHKLPKLDFQLTCHKQFQPNLYNLQQLSHKSCTQQLKFLHLNNEVNLLYNQQMDWPMFLLPNRLESHKLLKLDFQLTCHKQFQPNLYNLQQLSHKLYTQQL